MSRTPETWVDHPSPFYLELIDLQPSDDNAALRAQIPRVGRDCVAWLKSWNGGSALIELAEPGRIRMLPWLPYSAELNQRRQQLIQAADEEALEELLFLTERYRRVHVEPSGRLPFHNRELVHLGLPKTGGLALLVCMPDRVEFWSEDFRRLWRQRSPHRALWDVDGLRNL